MQESEAVGGRSEEGIAVEATEAVEAGQAIQAAEAVEAAVKAAIQAAKSKTEASQPLSKKERFITETVSRDSEPQDRFCLFLNSAEI